MTEAAWLKEIDTYLIDLDGTLYRGRDVIEDAPAFVAWLQRTQRKFLYVTNNSSRRPEDVAAHLRELGIPAEADDVLTSSQVAAQYIREQPGHHRVFMIGETGLHHALHEAGCQIVNGTDEQPDYVVQGIDREFSYAKLKRAALAVRAGAVSIATNVDKALPTEEGLLPGSGSLAAALMTTTGVTPLVMGKPAAKMIEVALERLGSTREQAVVIGDNLETDILAGVQADVKTVLVLTGFSQRAEIASAAGVPTLVLDSLTELMALSE